MGAFVALVVAAPILAFIGVSALLSDDSKDDPTAEGEQGDERPDDASVALMIQNNAEGRAVAATLLVLGDTTESAVVFLPLGSMVQIPSFGQDRLGVALQNGGVPLARQTIENLLGVKVDLTAVVDDAVWSNLMASVGSVAFENPSQIERLEANGDITPLWPQGPVELAPDQVGAFLAARNTNEPDVTRLVRHLAFWQVWMKELENAAAPPAQLNEAGDPVDLQSFVQALAKTDELSFQTLPVESVSAGLPDEIEMYSIDREGLEDLTTRLVPNASGASSSRIRVQILNGTGTPGLAQLVTDKLGLAGIEVALTDNADSFAYTETQIVIFDRENQSAAEQVRAALGVGRIVLSRQGIDVVDVQVVVGSDFIALSATTAVPADTSG